MLRRCSLRLKGYDYGGYGAYFVTICVTKRKCSLGSVVNGIFQLSKYGKIAADSWKWLQDHYSFVKLDEWVIMPNHLHGIVVLGDSWSESPSDLMGRIRSKPLGRLIGAFKTVSTKKINVIRQMEGVPFWQRNFYDHVIRDEDSLNRIREYIVTNPQRWELDRENPRAIGEDDFDLWLSAFNPNP
jgi:putative transposase